MASKKHPTKEEKVLKQSRQGIGVVDDFSVSNQSIKLSESANVFITFCIF